MLPLLPFSRRAYADVNMLCVVGSSATMRCTHSWPIRHHCTVVSVSYSKCSFFSLMRRKKYFIKCVCNNFTGIERARVCRCLIKVINIFLHSLRFRSFRLVLHGFKFHSLRAKTQILQSDSVHATIYGTITVLLPRRTHAIFGDPLLLRSTSLCLSFLEPLMFR